MAVDPITENEFYNRSISVEIKNAVEWSNEVEWKYFANFETIFPENSKTYNEMKKSKDFNFPSLKKLISFTLFLFLLEECTQSNYFQEYLVVQTC